MEIEDWGSSVHFVLRFQGKSMQRLSAFLLLFGNKKNSKSSIFFIPWLLNSSDLPSYCSDLKKRYTLKLFSTCLGMRTLPTPHLTIPFDWLVLAHLCTYVLAKILQNGAKLIQKLASVFKITCGIWATPKKQWKVQKVEIWWATFLQKIYSFS